MMRQKTQKKNLRKEKKTGKEKKKNKRKKAFLFIWLILSESEIKNEKKNLKIDFSGFQLPDVTEKKRKTLQSSIYGSNSSQKYKRMMKFFAVSYVVYSQSWLNLPLWMITTLATPKNYKRKTN